MVFLGDVACPNDKIDNFLHSVNNENLFKDKIVIYNLEGNIRAKDGFEKGLNNAQKIVEAFSGAKKVIVSLANNHMYDYPNEINATKDILDKNGIGYFGLSTKFNEILPYEYQCTDTGAKYAFFGHCWSLYTKTNPNTQNGMRIVDFDYSHFIAKVAEYIDGNQDTKVICFMHWNYDMEILPFPMLRKVSHRLIDIGVEAVIGSHSHVPQGTETYKGKLIAYCLGNFYIPSGCFFEGNLKYPSESKASYVVKYSSNLSDYECKWFHTDINEQEPICFDFSNDAAEKKMKQLSFGFEYDDTKYLKYFLKNRKKKFLVPRFITYKGVVHALDEWFAVGRIRLIKAIKRR